MIWGIIIPTHESRVMYSNRNKHTLFLSISVLKSSSDFLRADQFQMLTVNMINLAELFANFPLYFNLMSYIFLYVQVQQFLKKAELKNFKPCGVRQRKRIVSQLQRLSVTNQGASAYALSCLCRRTHPLPSFYDFLACSCRTLVSALIVLWCSPILYLYPYS